MMSKFGAFIAKAAPVAKKAAPIAKKVAPVVFAAAISAVETLSDQKAAMHIENLEQRIKDLEGLLKK